MSNPSILDPMNTIHGLYRSYQNNSTKPSIVVQAYLDKIERLNPRLGAYQNTWADTALEMAAAADKALASGCLLYTSPSPRDRQKSRMPSSA